MSLPNGWALASLGELARWSGGGTPSKDVAAFWSNGTVPWVSPKDMKCDRIRDTEDHVTEEAVRGSAAKHIPAGSVLVVTRSGILEHTLPVAVTDVGVTVNQDLKALTPVPGVDADYLAWAVRAHSSAILESCKKDGTTVASIESDALRRFSIPVAPTKEQRLIVEVIESQVSRLDAAAGCLVRAESKLKAYRASVLKAAVEGRLVPTEASLARAERRTFESAEVLLKRILAERRRRWEDGELKRLTAVGKSPKNDRWKEKYQEPVGPNMTGLPSLPTGWCWASLGLMKEFSLYGPRFSSEDYAEDGILVLRTSDISEGGKVDLSTPPRMRLSDEDYTRYAAQKGDLLITRTGSIGTLAVLNDEVRAIPGAYLIQYRLAAPSETVWYCFHFLKSPAAQAALVGGGKGVGRPNLNAPTIEAIPVPLPPIAEQARINEEIRRLFSVSDRATEQVALNRRRVNRLRQAALKWAFEGRLVDQDPTNEHAEKLLERARGKRAEAVQTVRKTRATKAKATS